MDCRQVKPLLETFVDGELSAEHTLDVETHLGECDVCSEHLRFAQAVKFSTREAVLAQTVVSDEFRERLERALAAEQQREQALESGHVAALGAASAAGSAPQTAPLRWRTIAGIVAAAAALMFWVGSKNWMTGDSEIQNAPLAKVNPHPTPSVLSSDLGVEQALDRLIDYHSSPPQPQVTQPELLPALEPNVGVRVHLPEEFDRFGAQWEGAALVRVSNHQAASLRYRIPEPSLMGKGSLLAPRAAGSEHRVTVYVYDPSKVPVHRSLQRRLILNDPIYLGKWRGFTVAAKQNEGVGYAVATDISDDSQIADLVRAIH